jgi:hypothetical protein
VGLSATSAQTLGHADFAQWTKYARDSSSHYYYPRLLERFLRDDSTLTDEEVVLLSHGYTLQKGYSPYGQTLIEDSVSKFDHSGEYSKAFECGKRYLRTNPVSIGGNLVMAITSKNLDSIEDFQRYQSRLHMLLRAVMSTGTGESPDSAFAVISTRDEYIILSYLGYSSSSQALLAGKEGRSYDKLIGVSKDSAKPKRDFYFDVTRQLNSLAGSLEEK